MKVYPFLINNENKIRNHFNDFKDFVNLSKERKEVIDLLGQNQSMKTLCLNETFCQNVVKALFPKDIVALFGGYKQLLELPSYVIDESLGKYMQLSADFLPNGIDIALTMSNCLRPIIAIRLSELKEDGKENIISYHARYSRDNTNGNWVVGIDSGYQDERRDSIFYVQTLWDLPQHKGSIMHVGSGYFGYLKDIIEGEMINDNGRKVCCRATYEDKNAIKIQSFVRAKAILAAYRQYSSCKAELNALQAESQKLIGNNKITEGLECLSEAREIGEDMKDSMVRLGL